MKQKYNLALIMFFMMVFTMFATPIKVAASGEEYLPKKANKANQCVYINGQALGYVNGENPLYVSGENVLLTYQGVSA